MSTEVRAGNDNGWADDSLVHSILYNGKWDQTACLRPSGMSEGVRRGISERGANVRRCECASTVSFNETGMLDGPRGVREALLSRPLMLTAKHRPGSLRPVSYVSPSCVS
jgi:hypothetical protein